MKSLTDQFDDHLATAFNEQGFAIPRHPNQVVLQIVDRMFGPPEHSGPLSYRKSLCPLVTGPYIPDLPVGALRAIGKDPGLFARHSGSRMRRIDG